MQSVLIVTRTKNRPLLLRRAILSVQQQSFTDFKHVIVNDGGDSKIVDTLVESLNLGNIHIIHNTKSVGMEAASNIGLKSHSAKYAVIHDDDDSWHTDFLAQSVSFLENHPEHIGVVCNIQQLFESVTNNEVEQISSRLFNPAVKTFRLNDFFVVNQFVPIAFLYRYHLHDKIGLYDEKFKVCGDLDFFIRGLQKYQIGKISSCLANYHIRVNEAVGAMSNSVSSTELHKYFSNDILKRYDKRSITVKLYSWLRVKFFYRLLNVFIRFMDKFRIHE